MPSPEKTVFDFSPPSSPASKTSAHAVPSGKGSVPCSSTISAERSGTMKMRPSNAAQSEIIAMIQNDGFETASLSLAHMKSAGSVKIAPAASDSPAEPMVCTKLFSRIESRFKMMRMIPIERTAAGIEAETVMPTRRPRYAFAAPNSTASRIPRPIETGVISGKTRSAEMNGLKVFSSITPTLLK